MHLTTGHFRKGLVSLSVLVASVLGMGAFTAIQAVTASPAYAQCPIDPEVPCGGGGGSGGGGTPVTYRVVGQVTPISTSAGSVKFRGWSRFERNGIKIDASTLSVQCVAGTGQSDQDSENNAGFTDVEFWAGPLLYGGQIDVICYHQATYAGVVYTASSQVSALAPPA